MQSIYSNDLSKKTIAPANFDKCNVLYFVNYMNKTKKVETVIFVLEQSTTMHFLKLK